jgi:hypothetical protein
MPEEEDDASHPAEGADTPPQNGCCIGTGVPIWEPSENTASAGFPIQEPSGTVTWCTTSVCY